jgi:hypothetical protein
LPASDGRFGIVVVVESVVRTVVESVVRTVVESVVRRVVELVVRTVVESVARTGALGAKAAHGFVGSCISTKRI